MDRIYQL